MTTTGCGWQHLCHGNTREVCDMWNYEKRLQYPINIKNCNPTLAAMIISQYGGLYFIKVYNIKIKMKVVIAMRNFKVNGTKVSIVNRCTNGMEINSLNQKYDIMIFNAAYNAWTRLCSCMTLAEGKEIAAERIEAMQQLAIMV